MTASVARGFVALAVAIVALALGVQSVSAEGTVTGELRRTAAGGGVALVHWSGGSVDDLHDAAEQRECDLRVVWVTSDGRLLRYVVGAPPFVNVDWLAVLGGPEVAAGPILVRCITPDLRSCTARVTAVDHPVGTARFATAEAAVKAGAATLPDLPTGPLSAVAGGEEDGLENETWAIFNVDGLPVARLVAVRADTGWLLSTATFRVFS